MTRLQAAEFRELTFQSFDRGELTMRDLVARLTWINMREWRGGAGHCQRQARVRCYCSHRSR